MTETLYINHRPPSGRLLRGHIAIAFAFAVVFYAAFVRTGSVGADLASRRATIEREQPEVLLVGNSLLRAAVSGPEFSQIANVPTTVAYSNGSTSAWWYLYVKNVVGKARHKPAYVGILFRDTFLTEPCYRVTGSWQKSIRKVMTEDEPTVQQLSYGDSALSNINSPLNWVPREARNWVNLKIEKRLEDLLGIPRGSGKPAVASTFVDENMVDGLYNRFQLAFEQTKDEYGYQFAQQIAQSYLPRIIDELRQHHIVPVFIRARRRRDLSPEPALPQLSRYIRQLEQYLSDRGAILIDFSNDDRIREHHFGAGDHLTKTEGRALFQDLLAERLAPQLAHRARSPRIRVAPVSIERQFRADSPTGGNH